jgi:hypothetical protein
MVVLYLCSNISNKGRGGATQQKIAGVDESVFGKTVTPIEFRTLEIADSIANYGLEQFLGMIRYVAQHCYIVKENGKTTLFFNGTLSYSYYFMSLKSGWGKFLEQTA